MLKVCGTSSDSNLLGDHPCLGGTTYGTVDSPAGPSMAAIDSPAGPSTAIKFAVDGLAGPHCGGIIGGVTDINLYPAAMIRQSKARYSNP